MTSTLFHIILNYEIQGHHNETDLQQEIIFKIMSNPSSFEFLVMFLFF